MPNGNLSLQFYLLFSLFTACRFVGAEKFIKVVIIKLFLTRQNDDVGQPKGFCYGKREGIVKA